MKANASRANSCLPGQTKRRADRRPFFYRSPALLFALGVCVVGLSFAACSTQPSEGVVEQISPPPGSTAVSADTKIFVRTNIPLDPQLALASESLTVKDADGKVQAGTLRLEENDTKLTFVPDAPLPQDESIFVCLSADVRTASGGLLRSYRPDPELDLLEAWSPGRCFEFSTESSLTVRTAYFADQPTEVRVYFSQQVDASSIQDASVFVTQSGQSWSVGLRYSPTQNRLTVFPPEALSEDAPFTVRLPAELHATDGRLLNEGEGSVVEVDGQEVRIW